MWVVKSDGLQTKIARWRRGATQWELGRISDIPPYRLSAFERGAIRLRPEEIERLREALNSLPVERP